MCKTEHANGCSFARKPLTAYGTSWITDTCDGSLHIRHDTDGMLVLDANESCDNDCDEDDEDFKITIKFNYCPECGVQLHSDGHNMIKVVHDDT